MESTEMPPQNAIENSQEGEGGYEEGVRQETTTPLPPHLKEAFGLANKVTPTPNELQKVYDAMDANGCVGTPEGVVPFAYVAKNPEKYGFECGIVDDGDTNPPTAKIPSLPENNVSEVDSGKEGVVEKPLQDAEYPALVALHERITEAKNNLDRKESRPWPDTDNQYEIPYARIVLERAQQQRDAYRLEQALAQGGEENREHTIRTFLAEQARAREVDALETQIKWDERTCEAYVARVARTERGLLKLRDELEAMSPRARDRGYVEGEIERLEREYADLHARRGEHDAQRRAIKARKEEIRTILAQDVSAFAIPDTMEGDPDFKACKSDVFFSASHDEAIRKSTSHQDFNKEAEALFRKRFPQKAEYYDTSRIPTDESPEPLVEVQSEDWPPHTKASIEEQVSAMTSQDVVPISPEFFSTEDLSTHRNMLHVSSDVDTKTGESSTKSDRGADIDPTQQISIATHNTVPDNLPGVDGRETPAGGDVLRHTPHTAQTLYTSVSEPLQEGIPINTSDGSIEHGDTRTGDDEVREFVPMNIVDATASETHITEADVHSSRASLGGRLLEYLTGLTLEHPEAVLARLELDQSALRAKYGLPARGMRFNDPSEYERILRKKAREYGVSIRPADEFGEFFASHPYAGGIADKIGKRIGVGFGVESRDDYERMLGVLEHEIIHAGQHLYSPGMPDEVREYEAYVAGSSFKHLHDMEVGEMRESLETFFGMLLGGSVMHGYAERGVEPAWNSPTFFKHTEDAQESS